MSLFTFLPSIQGNKLRLRSTVVLTAIKYGCGLQPSRRLEPVLGIQFGNQFGFLKNHASVQGVRNQIEREKRDILGLF